MTIKKENRYDNVMLWGALAVGAMLISCVHDTDCDDFANIEMRHTAIENASNSDVSDKEGADADQEIEDAVKDHYIVVFKPGTLRGSPAKGRALRGTLAKSDSEIAATMKADFGARTHRTYRHSIEGATVTITDKAAIKRLENDSRVAYVVPDEIVTLASAQENPPSWGLDRIDQETPALDKKYNYEGTGKGVHVYVLDSGVYAGHKDFTGRILEGYDFIGNDTTPEDCHGHGTHIAGTVLGEKYGVAKEAFLHPIRVLGCQKKGTASGILAGVDWITANHIKPAVVNMSIGSPKNQALDDAVSASIEAGIFYSIAAGNNAMDACEISPTSVHEAMVVANSDNTDTRSPVSNFGPCVDIFAPGENIVSADLSSTGSTPMSGTSMAAPHVAGAAALLLGARPEMIPAELHAEIIAAATPGVITDPGEGTPNLLVNTSALFISGAGRLLFDEHTTACDSTLFLTLVDEGLAGSGSTSVAVETDLGDDETITLIEGSGAEGEFVGALTLIEGAPNLGDNVIQTADGVVITATYQDEDDGTGSPVTVTNTATVDCSPPILSNMFPINRFGTSVEIELETDEVANVFANVGTSCSNLIMTTQSTAIVPPMRKLIISDLEKSTTYYYTLTAEDWAGNVATFDNGGACFNFTTADELFFVDFESGLGGITLDLPNTTAEWHLTDACQADLHGHSASTVLYWGHDNTCDSTGSGSGTGSVITPSVTVDFDQNLSLTFSNYLQKDFGDHTAVELIIDGGSPIPLSLDWFPSTPVEPLYSGLGVWSTKTFLLDEYGTGTANIQIKFTFSQNSDSASFMIDDISIDSSQPPCTDDSQCHDGYETTIDTCDTATGQCSHDLVSPDVCDESNAMDMGPMYSSVTVSGDACLKITQYPGSWARYIVLQAQDNGSGYPIPFSWSNCESGGTGSITGDWSQSVVGPVNSSCTTIINMTSSNSDQVTLRRWTTG